MSAPRAHGRYAKLNRLRKQVIVGSTRTRAICWKRIYWTIVQCRLHVCAGSMAVSEMYSIEYKSAPRVCGLNKLSPPNSDFEHLDVQNKVGSTCVRAQYNVSADSAPTFGRLHVCAGSMFGEFGTADLGPSAPRVCGLNFGKIVTVFD